MCRSYKLFKAQISQGGRHQGLGYFATAVEAAVAYSKFMAGEEWRPPAPEPKAPPVPVLLLDQAGMLLLDQAGKTGLGQTTPRLGTTGKNPAT